MRDYPFVIDLFILMETERVVEGCVYGWIFFGEIVVFVLLFYNTICMQYGIKRAVQEPCDAWVREGFESASRFIF